MARLEVGDLVRPAERALGGTLPDDWLGYHGFGIIYKIEEGWTDPICWVKFIKSQKSFRLCSTTLTAYDKQD
jgi:hypothetical protein